MEKSELANQLRRRQITKGLNASSIVNSLTDDKIIDCYITCSCCGEKEVNEIELLEYINEANDDSHFFDLLENIEKHH